MKRSLPFIPALLRTAQHPLSVMAISLGLLAGCATSNTAPSASTPPTMQAPSSSTQPSAASALLSGYHWQLQQVRAADGSAQPGWKPSGPGTDGTAIQLNFTDEGMLSVRNLCNQLAGRYTLDGNRMNVGHLVSTMRACNNRPLMELEQRVAKRLAQLSSWQMQKPQGDTAPVLTLIFQDGGRWELQGQPTPATLYGSTGVREFLEVAPAREACTGVAPMQCLKVRSVHYDSRGLKTEVGPWQLFYSEIEGYRHEPGVRNVLRVQRYERKNPPADASRYVYVLDMVVESEIVKPR